MMNAADVHTIFCDFFSSKITLRDVWLHENFDTLEKCLVIVTETVQQHHEWKIHTKTVYEQEMKMYVKQRKL